MAHSAIESNQTGLAIAEEESLKTLPGTPVWFELEPNTYGDFGPDYSMIARTPITNTRQQRKGVITDLSAKANFQVDLTQHNLQRLMQGILFMDALEKAATQPFNGTQVALTAITATQFQAVAGLDVFHAGDLFFAKGCGIGANNGLARATATAAGAVTTDKALTAEGAPPASSQLEAVGFQFAADDATLTVVAGQLCLNSTVKVLTELGLHVGEWMWVGGDLAINRFATAADLGFARVQSIAAHQIVFDLVLFNGVADAGAGKDIRIFFGKVVRNAVIPSEIKRRTYQVERQLGNDDDGVQSEVVIGSIENEATFNLKEASKVEVDLAIVGLDVEPRSGADGIKGGTRIPAAGEAAFNTSLDMVAMRVGIVQPGVIDPGTLFGYATDAKLVINNNCTPDKALAVLGGFEVNTGQLAVSGTITAYFTSVEAIAAIRDNADVNLSMIFAKQNAGILFDLPLLSLGGGLNKVEKDKPIMTDLTQSAAMNAHGYTILVNFFEYLPTVAMP